MTDYLEVPFEQLSEEALQGVLEDYINREGTDYGEYEFSLAEKVEQLKGRLTSGDAAIVFDPESETCSFINKRV